MVTLATGLPSAKRELTGKDRHWIDIELVCSRLEEDHTKALDTALEYARDNELLACGPVPMRSVMLTHKGLLAARQVQ